MGLILVTEYLAAVRATCAYYARRGDVPETLARLAEHVESLHDFHERIAPALVEYRGVLPLALEELLRDVPEDED